jgi:hypothetical protein
VAVQTDEVEPLRILANTQRDVDVPADIYQARPTKGQIVCSFQSNTRVLVHDFTVTQLHAGAMVADHSWKRGLGLVSRLTKRIVKSGCHQFSFCLADGTRDYFARLIIIVNKL